MLVHSNLNLSPTTASILDMIGVFVELRLMVCAGNRRHTPNPGQSASFDFNDFLLVLNGDAEGAGAHAGQELTVFV